MLELWWTASLSTARLSPMHDSWCRPLTPSCFSEDLCFASMLSVNAGA